MNSYRFYGVLALTALTALSGCGSVSLTENKKIDYKSAGKLPTLEIPPDLTTPGADGRFAVPDISPAASATFSEYSKERVGGKPQAGPAELLPAMDKVRIERAGSQRWLVINASPEQAWPVIKEFWAGLGFTVQTELPEAGIIETGWAENRAKIPQDAIRNVLSKVLDNLYSTSERDKFRTRLEPGQDKGTTEIYISHRGMYEVVREDIGSSQTVWQPRPADPELEAEMLRRLMVKFGVDEARAASAMAAQAPQERAKVSHNKEGSAILALADPFDRAWRRVGLALDRVGFTVEDRDRSKGLYFVRYADPDADGKKADQSMLSKLAFWRTEATKEQKAAQYRIEVAESAGASQVRVLGQDGGSTKAETGNKIINLLYEQLK